MAFLEVLFCLRGQGGTVFLMTLKKFGFLLSLGRFSKPKSLRFEDQTCLFPSLLTVEEFGKILTFTGLKAPPTYCAASRDS